MVVTAITNGCIFTMDTMYAKVAAAAVVGDGVGAGVGAVLSR